MESWYFAYGSNLWIDQMVRRTGPLGQGPWRPRIARLSDHRLVFQHLTADGPAYANIVRPGDGVLGVVYRCRPEGLAVLDRYERGYERRIFQVVDEQGEILEAMAYVITPAPAVKDGKPSGKYLEKILAGARQHALPEAYIASIVASAGLTSA